ncbi:MAG: ATPase, T2SS/T4P/T4SS family [Vicinamibacterales bacterium]
MTNAELDARLAELLSSYGMLSETVIAHARTFQAQRGGTLAGSLRELQLVETAAIGALLQELTGARAVDPTLLTVYPEFVERSNALIPPDIAAELFVFPAQMEVNTIHVCLLNPTDGYTTRALEALSGCHVQPLVSHEGAIADALARHYAPYLRTPIRWNEVEGRARLERHYREALEVPFETLTTPAVSLVNRNRDAIARDRRALEQVIRDPVIIRLVHQMVCRAIETGASDIHVEPTGNELRVRLRVDGAMRGFADLPPSLTTAVTSRLKAMANLPLDAAAAPLDSRIGYDLVLGRGVDLRFSLVPSVTGEKIVLRVLDRSRERRRLVDLGMDDETRALIEGAAGLPNGLMLVTGPTGSGKSSTLYALLDRLNDSDTAILTAEDPVESRVQGVTQVQCEEDTGVTFASALRSFLRQDPDVIMVGEIRDAETADIALKAALTGHLVLSTLHTNDSPGAILRLINMNLEPFIIASSLRLVVAQRLIRRLCTACRRAVAPDDRLAERIVDLGLTPERLAAHGTVALHEAVGCRACSQTGYRGRTGIFEVLRVTPAIEELVIRRASTAEIRLAAKAEGMRTLRQSALLKALAGETSLAEVLEHTVSDDERGSAVRHDSIPQGVGA